MAFGQVRAGRSPQGAHRGPRAARHQAVRHTSPPLGLTARALAPVIFAALVFPLAAANAQALFNQRPVVIVDPQPERFSLCWSHSCSIVATVALPPPAWHQVRDVFRETPSAPADERALIAAAIALLEKLVGDITGTSRDRGGDLRGFARPGQMDCVDEANNSTTYLKMLAADGLLRWHKVGEILKRGHIIFGMPHATAIITDTTTGEHWAVDSWYLDNGEPPYIVPYEIWRTGWNPPKE